MYFALFTAFVFLLLWLLQTVFLQGFYNSMIIRNTKIAPTPLYADEYSTESVPGGPLRFKAHGRALRPDEAPEGTDVWAVLNGYISVGIVRSEVFPEDCQ